MKNGYWQLAIENALSMANGQWPMANGHWGNALAVFPSSDEKWLLAIDH